MKPDEKKHQGIIMSLLECE